MLRRFWLSALFAGLVITPAGAQAPNPSFNVVNRTPDVIAEVYATKAGAATWGRNRIGGRPVPPGQTGAIRLPADGSCVYDVRVIYANGQSEQRQGLNTCNLDNLFFPSTAGHPAGR